MNSQEITSKDEMTGRQRDQIITLIINSLDTTKQNVASIVDRLNLENTEAQGIIEKGNLQELFQNAISDSLKQHVIITKLFGAPSKRFTITVPMDYNHDAQIDTFIKQRKITSYHSDLTSKNFANATNKLEPGQTYDVEIIPILSVATRKEYMMFHHNRKHLLVGPQGLTLVYQLKKDELPKDKRIFSLDEDDALFKDDDGDTRFPCIEPGSNDDYFDLDFQSALDFDDCLLCFLEKTS